MCDYIGTTSHPYYAMTTDTLAAFTPQSLPSNEKPLSHAGILQLPLPARQLSFYDLYTRKLPSHSSITIGRFAGALCLLWYNKWEDLKAAATGLINPRNLRLFLPDYFMKYIHTVLEKGQISEQNLKVALIYALRFRVCSNIGIASPYTSEARIFITALLVANKMEDDVSYSTKSWADLSNINYNELRRMETEFLRVTNFRLHITSSSWNECNEFIDQFVFPLVDEMLDPR